MRACWIHTGLAGNDLFFLSIDPSCYPKSVYSRHCGRPAHPARCKRIICQCRDQPVLRVLLTPFFYPFLPPPLDPLSVCFPSLHHFSFLFVQGQQLKIGGTLIGTSHPQLQHSILTTAKMKATSTQIWHFQSLMGSAVRPQV